MKGVIDPDHIPVNNYELRVPGLPTLLFTAISGVEEELDAVDMPDRTKVSGGHTKVIEFTATQPLHHKTQVDAMNRWWKDSQDPVAVDYKKNATLVLKSISGLVIKNILYNGIFPTKRKMPDFAMDNEGEEATIEWTFGGDSMEIMG